MKSEKIFSFLVEQILQGEKTINYLVYHDLLTGLPNRVFFNSCLDAALDAAEKSKRMLSILLLDLDRFKLINDTLGYTLGDKLLQEVTERMLACLEKEDTLVRLGGDEFAVLLPNISSGEGAKAVAEKILATIRQPFDLAGQQVYITTSIGISVYPDDGVDGQALLKNADVAMYRAKESGRNNCQFYNGTRNELAFKRLALESRLVYALEQGEFILHYQPQIDMKTEKIIGMEALIRWQHPDLGLIPPNEFIPLVEENGFIIPLGEWVIRTACQQNKQWQEVGFSPLRVAVNLSRRQFQQPNFVEMIKKILEQTGLEPCWLELEITESLAMQDLPLTLKIITELKEMGIYFSIDDFGSGYSFLNCLKNVPVNALKIDPSFINNLHNNSSDAVIATAVIDLAHNLNLQVTAEGVETHAQLDFLKQQKCDKLQGYLFSRPVAANVFKELLEKGGGKAD